MRAKQARQARQVMQARQARYARHAKQAKQARQARRQAGGHATPGQASNDGGNLVAEHPPYLNHTKRKQTLFGHPGQHVYARKRVRANMRMADSTHKNTPHALL